ncbi:MAG: Type 1 glutamine amidotransferase-like domain-containing protein [Oligoflexales bacterium]
MNLWMYSSGGSENSDVDQKLTEHLPQKRAKLTFVSSCHEDASEYYDEFIERFCGFGNFDFYMVHVDKALTRKDMSKLGNSDLIYLSGGNTFYFLKTLKNNPLKEHLRQHIKQNRILAGHSAGSILMTPTISTAGYPEHDCDDNFVGITNLRALKLVNFEVLPHYRDLRRYDDAIFENIEGAKFPVYAMKDGASINVGKTSLSFYGDIWLFHNGSKIKISSRYRR